MSGISRIVHIVDNLLPLNFGIWNAAAGPWRELEKEGITSEIWYPASEGNAVLPDGLTGFELPSRALSQVSKWIHIRNMDPGTTLIMTHGSWQYPTRWGKELASLGFQWWAVPHGMLEAWSMNQKKLKKLVYFLLVERPALRQATRIRAVGSPERERLKKLLKRDVILIPNGIAGPVERKDMVFTGKIIYLFLSRLHHKKGVVPLVNAWLDSSLAADPESVLIVAGPDQGEEAKIKQILKERGSSNIRLTGPVYGEDKEHLLSSSHWFILPSQSEGFPTSVLEAMQYGLIPVISAGCNFPEAFESEMAIKTGITTGDIKLTLERCREVSPVILKEMSHRVRTFVEDRYSLKIIAARIIGELRI